MIDPRAREIFIKAHSKLEFFLIHGYSGSPTDFAELPSLLNKKFGANVRVIRLPGHGTKLEDLDNLNYSDFLEYAEKKLVLDLKKGKKIVLGGLSLGGAIALKLASKYPILAVPYTLKFPLNVPGLAFVFGLRRSWFNFSPNICSANKSYFAYPAMHTRGLKVMKEVRRDLASSIKEINCPVLSIYSDKEKIVSGRGVKEIHKNLSSQFKEIKRFSNKKHNIFFTDKKEEVYKTLINFIRKINLQ